PRVSERVRAVRYCPVPRDTYHMYEDARQVLRPSNGRISVKKTKTSASGLKKIFGL
ncbi:hypothetical protein C8Q73DRAFT_704478, partial [Cubamyces lactineus]